MSAYAKCSVLLLALVSFGSGATEVGTTAGTFTVTPTGAATYSIPIAVPPGTSGMAPHLAIAYSSQAGNGKLGIGFALEGLSTITRCPTTLDSDGYIDGVDFDDNDQFCLDGKRLKAIAGANGRNNTEYRTEIEEFSRIVSYGGPSSGGVDPVSFRVWTKSGLVMDYGTTSDSRWQLSSSDSRAYGWGLARTYDAAGNYIDYSYYADSTTGEVMPKDIQYTGNANTGLPPNAVVSFVYGPRPDTSFGYIYGGAQQSNQRLAFIRTYVNGVQIREYRITYESQSAYATNRSRLSQIQECTSTTVCLPPTTFTWQKLAQTFQWKSVPAYQPPSPVAIDQAGDNGARLVDLNGDGLMDFVYHRYFNGTHISGAYINTGTGWQSAPNYVPPVPIVYDTGNGNQDNGVRFVDVNNDGLVDIVYYRYLIDGSTQRGAYINTGTGWQADARWTPPYHIAYDNGTGSFESGVHFVDVNGDGRPDMLYYRYLSTGSQIGAYINTGSGWQLDSSYNPPYPINENGNDLGTRLEDINGDGLPDFIYSRLLASGVWDAGAYLNTGSGWQLEPAYAPPVKFEIDGVGDAGARLIDVNGDRLPDIVYHRTFGSGNQVQGAYINTGHGWTSDPAYTPPFHLAQDGFGELGGRFEDVNGDGLPDLLYYRYIDTGSEIGAYLNTGQGWQSNSAYTPPNMLAASSIGDTGARFADINGDGLPDFVYRRVSANSGDTGQSAYTNPSPHELVTTITNGLGAQVQLTYSPLTDGTIYTKGSGATYPYSEVQAPIYVVSSTAASNGIGGLRRVDYRYEGARLNFSGRGLVGFAKETVTDEGTSIREITTYRQDFPFIGRVTKHRTETTSGEAISVAETVWDSKVLDPGTSATRYFAYPKVITERACEPSASDCELAHSSVITSKVTQNEYGETVSDAQFHGNLTRSTIQVFAGYEGSSVPYTTINDNQYQDDASSWHVGRLVLAKVTRCTSDVGSCVPGDATRTRTSSFEYDGNTGLLSSETVEPLSSTLWQKTAYVRDSYGNVIQKIASAYGASTRTTSITFDGRGQFVTQMTDPLMHTALTSYEPGNGNLISSTDPNHLTTSWAYDSFGRKTEEDRPDGSWTRLGRQLCSWGGCLSAGVFQLDATQSDGSESHVVYDLVERQVANVSLSLGSEYSAVLIEYGADGRVSRKSSPYFIGSTTPYWTTYTYDLMGRLVLQDEPTSQDLPSGRITRFSYYMNRVIETDPMLKSTTRILDGLGHVSSIVDADGNSSLYQYDDFDNLISAQDPLRVPVQISYDLRGRKIRVHDPDASSTRDWTYSYDGFGELLSQTDPKGQVVALSYDADGRLVARQEPEGTTSWVYDSASIHNLTRVDSPGYSRSQYYDQYSRLQTAAYSINGSWFTYDYYYDSQSRLIGLQYPDGFWIARQYNSHGYLYRVATNPTGGIDTAVSCGLTKVQNATVRSVCALAENKLTKEYWALETVDAWGHETLSMQGNGVETMRAYDLAVGEPTSIMSGSAGTANVQSLNYEWDLAGNLTARTDQNQGGLRETFQYDDLHRLVRSSVSPVATNLTDVSTSQTDLAISYDAAGNITFKSDVGNYTYGDRPHAVYTTSGSGAQNTYDENGNPQILNFHSYLYASYNLPLRITRNRALQAAAQTCTATNTCSSLVTGVQIQLNPTDITQFQYGPDRERIAQVATSPTDTESIIYVGSMFEQHSINASSLNKHYIQAAGHAVAIYTSTTANAGVSTHYLHYDHLGSVDVVTDENGGVVERLSYDAFGKRRSFTWLQSPDALAGVHDTHWGYTGHEHLDNEDLIHMDGRVYDPILGRFASRDPFVSLPFSTQGLNRFSYVENNPLSRSDPSGFSWRHVNNELHRWNQDYTAEIQRPNSLLAPTMEVVGIVVSYYVCDAGGYWCAAAISGLWTAGVAESEGASDSQSLEAGVVAAAETYAFAQIGKAYSGAHGLTEANVERIVLHGVVGAIASEAQGGTAWQGFVGAVVPTMFDEVSVGNVPVDSAIHAVIGGTASQLAGGKFANGAMTAAFGYLFNWCSDNPAECQGVFDKDRGAVEPVYPVESLVAGAALGPLARGLYGLFAADAGADAATAMAARVFTANGELRLSATAAKSLSSRPEVSALAIRETIAGGVRVPDPQGVAGRFMYYAAASFRGRLGTLEVLVNEQEGIVEHALYRSAK